MILDLRNPFPNLLALIFAGILLFVLVEQDQDAARDNGYDRNRPLLTSSDPIRIKLGFAAELLEKLAADLIVRLQFVVYDLI